MKIYLHEPSLMIWKEECFPDNRIGFIKYLRKFYKDQDRSLSLLDAKQTTDYLWKEWSKPNETSN